VPLSGRLPHVSAAPIPNSSALSDFVLRTVKRHVQRVRPATFGSTFDLVTVKPDV